MFTLPLGAQNGTNCFPETQNDPTSTFSSDCLNTQLNSLYRSGYPIEHSKRAKICPGNNLKTIMKQRRQHGMEYIGRRYNRNGNSFEKQLKPARKMLGRCSCKRSYQCHTISDDERKLIFADIWSMDDEEKRQYVRMQIDSVEPFQRRSMAEFSRRKQSLRYHLPVDGKRMRVCREMFLATTGLGSWWVLNAVTAGADDQICFYNEPSEAGGNRT
ncbi:hypothetical protein RRG08_009842 [Elysia crispata]|uniref:Uncharacterized protein n=1 Tax=Elysia crispata TaxID=231223 RepID=A0AAE0Z3Z9_9GAST|nr:hypothetical protein RRG08_009842 [Elysia crispata]